MMREAGYRQRTDTRDLSMGDDENEIEFFYLRPKDIATYVGSGDLHLGVTGADLQEESGSQVQEPARARVRRLEVPVRRQGRGRDQDDRGPRGQADRDVRTRAWCGRTWPRKRVRAEIVKLDGAVEISVQLGLADAIADVVSSGRTLRQHGLVVIGEPIAESQATLIEREPRPDRAQTAEVAAMKRVFTERLRGVVLARQYLMMDYDCPKSVQDAAMRITPGLQAPTISPLYDDGLGRRAVDGPAEQGEPGDGPARRAGREGDPHHGHPLVPRHEVERRSDA